MHRLHLLPLAGTAVAALALLAACGGGGDSPAPPFATASGTLRLSLTDAPSCGYDQAFVTVKPVSATSPTFIGSDAARIGTPVSFASHVASGTVTVVGSAADTGAAVRAMQTFSGGPTIEAGYSAADALSGGYGMRLPAGAPARLAYATGATTFNFRSMEPVAGLYRLEASAPGYTVKPADITLTADT